MRELIKTVHMGFFLLDFLLSLFFSLLFFFFSASAVLVSFTAGGGLSGAVGCHQGNKRHNVMRRHINESKCQRHSRFWQVKNIFAQLFFFFLP